MRVTGLMADGARWRKDGRKRCSGCPSSRLVGRADKSAATTTRSPPARTTTSGAASVGAHATGIDAAEANGGLPGGGSAAPELVARPVISVTLRPV